MPAGGRWIAAATCLVLAGGPEAAEAQSASTPTANGSQFLPRVDFQFSWASLLASDRRFQWEGRVTFDFDIVDHGTGRVSFKGDYGAVLGRERRRFDLNQGNYFFEAATSYRLRDVELVALILHVSRHVVDRDNEPGISWNTLGLRAHYRRPHIEGHLELTRIIEPAYVDYTWLSNARVAFRHPISARNEIIATAYGDVFGINHLVRDKRVCGGRIEGGFRVNGEKAAVELFAGYERRVDAYPTDRFRVRMFNLGFRVVSR